MYKLGPEMWNNYIIKNVVLGGLILIAIVLFVRNNSFNESEIYFKGPLAYRKDNDKLFSGKMVIDSAEEYSYYQYKNGFPEGEFSCSHNEEVYFQGFYYSQDEIMSKLKLSSDMLYTLMKQTGLGNTGDSTLFILNLYSDSSTKARRYLSDSTCIYKVAEDVIGRFYDSRCVGINVEWIIDGNNQFSNEFKIIKGSLYKGR